MTRTFTDTQLKAIGDHIEANKPISELKIPAGPVKKKRNNEESRAQRAVMSWWSIAHGTFRLPFNVFHSVPNGGFRSVVTSSIMKAEGQCRGVFDLKLNVARGGFHGLWLEMKAEKGVLSQDQQMFRSSMCAQGYAAVVARSFDEAVKIITDYLTQ